MVRVRTEFYTLKKSSNRNDNEEDRKWERSVCVMYFFGRYSGMGSSQHVLGMVSLSPSLTEYAQRDDGGVMHE